LKRSLSIILLIAILGAVGYFTYNRFTTKESIQVLESARVEKGNIRGVLVETGIIKPQVGALVKIGARATGAIDEMKVKIGDRVEQDELIALIDDREIQREIERLKAALASAQATFSQVKLTYPERIKEAEANYNYAKINYDREIELLKFEYTTMDAVDKARSELQATEANLKRLRDEARTQLQIASADIAEIEARLNQQQVNLSYTRIYAPISGVITEVTAQEGETVVTGLQVANLVTVLDPTRLEMWIYVDETDIGRVQVDQRVEYYVDTYPDKTFHGTINEIYPQPVIRDNIVYYLAISEVSREDASFLKPEMTTHVRIVFQEKEGILTAPNAAVKFEGGRQVAYKVLGPKNVLKQEVETGLRGEDKTEILSGVQEGDELATKLVLPSEAVR
jgi:multidrug efflux pump subunit AcrA (membrane-fusion protein)